MKEPMNKYVKVRCTWTQRKQYEARARSLGTTASETARRGLAGSPVEDLAIIRSALRLLGDEAPQAALIAWTRLTSGFAAVGSEPWPTADDKTDLLIWAPWAITILTGAK